MTNNNTLKYRVKNLEKTRDKHDDVLYGEHGILTNHIPHIQSDIQKLKALMVINIGAILLAAALLKFL